MTGTREGSAKARKTMLEKLGKDGYHQLMVSNGRKGGSRSSTGGFASKKIGKDGLTGAQRAKLAGGKGGKRSRRTNIKNFEGQIWKELEKKWGKISKEVSLCENCWCMTRTFANGNCVKCKAKKEIGNDA